MKHPICTSRIILATAALLFTLSSVAFSAEAPAVGPSAVSQPIASVLREPLPPEELRCTQTDNEITVAGPTFAYTVAKASGAIVSMRAERDGQPVLESVNAPDILVDDLRLSASDSAGKTSIVSEGKDKVVVRSEGLFGGSPTGGVALAYTLETTFFNDGVVVCAVRLVPDKDRVVLQHIRWQVGAAGRLESYLHKRRDQDGSQSAHGLLPAGGESVRFTTLSSCLQAFSPEAALAIFTDAGSTSMSVANMETATIDVAENAQGQASLVLTQYIVRVAEGAESHILKAGAPLTFRAGLALAPNRLGHRRQHDLRMFTWIGDAKYPYPTDDEIGEAARLGYTVFQLHRVGTHGEPRPPVSEFERVLNTVHACGMLFVWSENADLMYAQAPGCADLQAKGQWNLWQGFNYGGRYTAKMDPFCDMLATCLASPNGLADYRVANIERMLDRFQVDGIYLDDNLPYANCTLAKEHGHPQAVYDCLIELHEMNWRRREALRARCPHTVLIGHSASGLILPTICDFDAVLYGEGYGFGSLEDYWAFFGALNSFYAQGQIWPGDSEDSRCAAHVAYNYDLLTGGGQFEYCDWRLYPQKLPYAKGVTPTELVYVRGYNLAQYCFGLYESTPYVFAKSRALFEATAPLTYATIYRNNVWKDYLIAIANMDGKAQDTALAIHDLAALGLAGESQYAIYDVASRTCAITTGKDLANAFAKVAIPAQRLRLFYLRALPSGAPCHLWGGKRLAEAREATRLALELQGPAGLEDIVVLNTGGCAIAGVTIDGKSAEFSLDPAQGLAYGKVTFGATPVNLEATLAPDGKNTLSEQPIPPAALAQENPPAAQ